ncbi:MAG: FtsH protease activity modulator HflK [Porticoccus sp.]|uniref:FtsH protease activity modulator HflK n=1 Tax=Porticoccus sp. TaxID=2024853 RepID=UPI000C4DF1F1|nr:FtsH protease activity modulator HflK [Porticoccus sp.]MAZ69607.1 FtsH protease activity modulator HflK [Porticoccus sp.]|tara:strand:- start:12021 stop:13046 length:1026 start_codon:yes stop_codon:yes gene_type:complete
MKKNPWQDSSGGERDLHEDLAELLKKLPKGSAIVYLPVLLIVLWAVFSSFYTVQPEQQAVVKRFGAVVNITDPGLHFKLPFGIDRVQRVASARVLKQEFGFRSVGEVNNRTSYSESDFTSESLMLTGDLNVIDVEWVVQYRIQDPIKYLYQLRQPDLTLRDISESVMRRVVGNRLGSEVLTVGRVEIAQGARDEIQGIMDLYDSGIHVITVELQDVVPPKAVRPAFNEVNEARQERERMINEATKRANQQIPRAEGEAQRLISEAEGYATARVNRAFGETARFRAMLVEYKTVPEVTRTRLYLETMAEILPNIGQVLMVQEDQVGPLPLMNVRDARQGASK